MRLADNFPTEGKPELQKLKTPIKSRWRILTKLTVGNWPTIPFGLKTLTKT